MKRIKEFIRVFRIENPSLLATYRIFLGIFKVLPYISFKSAEDVREWKRRFRICLKCPIYDAELKRCRPSDNSVRGCGCYVPFSNIIYDKCWGRNYYGKPFGWGASDKLKRIKRIRRKRRNPILGR